MNPADYVYLAAFAPAILVTYAFAVRLSRAVEQTGRLQGRSTVNLLAGGLTLLNLIVSMVICRSLDIPLGTDEGAGPVDIMLVGAIALAAVVLLSFLTATGIRHLPKRRRGGPRRMTNSLLALLMTAMRVVIILVPVLLAVAFFGALITQSEYGFESLGPYEWAGVVVLPIVIMFLFVHFRRVQRKMSSNVKRLRPRRSRLGGRPVVLYLRPFDEEHRLFAGSQTLDEFLGNEIARHIGPLVALGNPTDRIAPEGAEREYYRDDQWQAAVERLALEASRIIAATSASPNTAWELRRVLELGLEPRLYLLSPPFRELQPPASSLPSKGPIRRALIVGGRALFDWLAQDWEGLSRELSFGHLPTALSPAGQNPWGALVETLLACGYTVDLTDPGPGAVIGFEPGGKAVLLANGASSPSDFLQPLLDRPTGPEQRPQPGPPLVSPPT